MIINFIIQEKSTWQNINPQAIMITWKLEIFLPSSFSFPSDEFLDEEIIIARFYHL